MSLKKTTYTIGEKGKEFEVERGDKVHYTDKKGNTTNYYFLGWNDYFGACTLIRVDDDEERNFKEMEEKVDEENYHYESPEILREGWIEPDFDEEQYETYEEARANMKYYAKKQSLENQFEIIWIQFIKSNPNLFKDPKFYVGGITVEQRNKLYRKMKKDFFKQAGFSEHSPSSAAGAGAGSNNDNSNTNSNSNSNAQQNESPTEKEKRECLAFLASQGIDKYSDFKEWALKGHPNKGGDQEIFKKVSACMDKTLKKDKENKKTQQGGTSRKKKINKKKNKKKHTRKH